MSKSRYSYAPDEFDTPAPQGAPVGVHRTQNSGWSKTWPFLVVAVVFAGLAFGGFKYFFDRDPVSPPPAASSSSPANNPVDGGTATDPGTGEPTVEVPTPEPTASEEPPAPADVNLAATVRVLNGAGVQGLAQAAADVLTGAGYTAVEFATYEGTALPASTVYYQSDELAGTASAIAAKFGIDPANIELVPANRAQVSVVLVTDFRS